LFSAPGFEEAEGGLYVLLVFYFLNYIFSDFCHTNYLNIHQTNLYEICSHSRTLAVDERSELVFRSLKGRFYGNQFLLTIFVMPDLRNSI